MIRATCVGEPMSGVGETRFWLLAEIGHSRFQIRPPFTHASRGI